MSRNPRFAAHFFAGCAAGRRAAAALKAARAAVR